MARPKNLVRFKLLRHKNASGTISWKVTGTTREGTRVRKNYSTKAEALQTISDLELQDEGLAEERVARRTSLSIDQLAEAEAAFQKIANRGLSTLVSHYLNLQERSQIKGSTLDQMFAFAEAHYRPETETITVLNATNAFLKSKTNITGATRLNYTNSFKHLLAEDPNRELHLFTVSDIERILVKHKNLNSRKSHQRFISSFFNWCVRHHYTLENPCSRLDPITLDKQSISVLSLPEIRRMLYAAIQYQDGATVAPIAIALFTGMRPSEIEDLKPKDIGKKTIKVTGGKLRRKISRVTPIPDNLKTWLKEYPFKGLPKGWDYKLKMLKAATKAKSWKQDVLRHTSITYQTERDKNEALTAFNCGTSPRMMDLHYRDSAPGEKSLNTFWDLTPTIILSKKERVKLPAKQSVEWPTKAKLEKLTWEKPMVQIAADLGISDVAIKKRCKKLGIKLPPRGHWLKNMH